MTEGDHGPATRPSVLLADDEQDLLLILEEVLKDGHDLTLVSNGLEAIERLGTGRFDLVVTDINMPGADGLAVLKAAKEADPESEVIVLTGNATTATAIEALRQGAHDYLLKPFDLFEMEQANGGVCARKTVASRSRCRRRTGISPPARRPFAVTATS